jgi:hypothetical protein
MGGMTPTHIEGAFRIEAMPWYFLMTLWEFEERERAT